MAWHTFLSMKFVGEHYSNIQSLDIAGVYWGWWGPTKQDIISHITQFAPSLLYLRFGFSAAVVESLPPSHWLFDEALGLTSETVSLPNTIKMVFVQGNHISDRTGHKALLESLKRLEEHDHRFKCLDSSDSHCTLSLQQLVDRVQ